MRISDESLLKTQAYIDGQWVDADSGETLAVTNPATGETIAEIAKCGTAETQRAIDAASRALVIWKQKTVKERAAVLRKWFDLVVEHQDDLGRIMTAEQGKPVPAEPLGE